MKLKYLTWIKNIALVSLFVFIGVHVNSQNLISRDFNNTDIRYTIKNIFADTHFSYSIDPSVQGYVTVKIKDIEFENALRTLLNSVKATYRIEGGIYMITSKPDIIETPIITNEPIPIENHTQIVQKIQIIRTDPQMIAWLLGGTIIPIEPSLLNNNTNNTVGAFGGSNYNQNNSNTFGGSNYNFNPSNFPQPKK